MPGAFRRALKTLVAALALLVLLGPTYQASATDSVHSVALDPVGPAALEYNTHVNVTYEYETDEPGGVYIWFRPFTEGELSPSYAAHPSPLHYGTGSDAGYFTITDGEVLVDHVRVQMWNSEQTVMLFEEFYPAWIHYAASGEITNIQLAPPWPATLLFEEQVGITFDYRTGEQSGVLVFFRPMTGDDLTPSYGAHPSPVYPDGSGAGTGWFTILAGEVIVDGIRVTMTDPSQTTIFHQFHFPVEYRFGSTPVEVETWGSLKSRYR